MISKMFDSIVKFVLGFNFNEIAELRAQVYQMDLKFQHQTEEIGFLIGQLNSYETRNKELQNELIRLRDETIVEILQFKDAIERLQQVNKEEVTEKVPVRSSGSWRKRQRQLEVEDYWRAKGGVGVGEPMEMWKEK